MRTGTQLVCFENLETLNEFFIKRSILQGKYLIFLNKITGSSMKMLIADTSFGELKTR
jgi:hypothetical protein